MKLLSRAIVATVCSLLAISIADAQSIIDQSLLSAQQHLLEQLSTRSDSLELLESAALLRIVDSALYEHALKSARTPTEFADIIRLDRKRHSNTWNEVDRRFNYARGRCETHIYDTDPDLRWGLFIRYGPPTAEWSTPTDCAGRGGGECITFIYSWSGQDRQVICQTDRDGWYPARIIEGATESDNSRRPVYPIVQSLVFPAPDSTFDVWVTAWIRGGDFTAMSLLDGLTRIELIIKAAGKQIVGRDSLIADLRLLRSVLSITKDKDAVMAMAYLSCTNLDPGMYTIELKVAGSGLNYGTHKTDLLVPSRFATNDLSDPVILTTRVPKGEEVQPGIMRNGETFYADPMRMVRQYDSLYLYHEFVVPQSDDSPSEYKITVSAFPHEQSSGRRDDRIEVGKIVDIQDTLGNPWGTTSRSGILADHKIDLPEGTEVLYQETIKPTGPTHILQQAVTTRYLDPNDYWLQISITDKEEERFFRTALTKITVK